MAGSITVTYDDQTTEEFVSVIGEGAQGVILGSRDGRSAVKLYHSDTRDPVDRARVILRLINDLNPTRDDPYWKDYFTWPEKLVVSPAVGYRMRLAGKMKTMVNYLMPKTFNSLPPQDKGWFLGRVAAAIKIANVAQRMSAHGICYPDFSFNNVMLDAFDGRMTLIDCDSITVPGTVPAEVLGTPVFLAPELWSAQQKIPTVTSDRHSLATVLYYLLVGYHPLIGDKVYYPDDADKDDVARFGPQALYIEDPTDQSNRRSGQLFFASMLGTEVEELFRQAFVKGLHHPVDRPQPQQWLPALVHAFDRIIPCETPAPRCWWHSFVALPQTNFTCPCCRARLTEPRTLPFVYLLPHARTKDPEDYDDAIGRDKHHIVGWPGRALFEWHTIIGKPAWHTDPQHPVSRAPHATFAHDDSTGAWYLKNEALPDMAVRVGGASWTAVPVGSATPLVHGALMRFGPGPTYYRAKVALQHLS